MALDGAGDALAVWSRSDGTNTIIQAAARPAGGPWQQPLDLSLAGQNASEPELVVNSVGDALAVWRRYDGANYIVQAAGRAAGGAWQQPRDLSAAGENAEAPQVAIDAAGDAVAVWSRSDGSNTIIQASTMAGGAWQSPVDLSAAGLSGDSADVALDSSGDAVAVWRRMTGAGALIESAGQPLGGTWSPPLPLSIPGQTTSQPRLAADGSGNVFAAWVRSDGTNMIIQGSEKPFGGDWQMPLDLSEAGQNSSEPMIAVDGAGDAVAVWRRYNGAHDIIQSATLPAGGAWAAPIDLSEDGRDASEPRLALDGSGDALAVWSRSNGTNTIIQAAARPAGGGWDGAVSLSEIGRNASEPEISADPDGDGAVIWSRFDGANTIVQAAGYDGAGPRLVSLQVPTAGTVRQPLSFSVAPLDVWSALGETTWSFGDGAAAEGVAVSHAYSRPGVYQVGVTSGDAVANFSTTTANVTIFAKASAKRIVRFSGRRAQLTLHCPSTTSCRGNVRLIAAIVLPGHRGRHRRRTIAAATFVIPPKAVTVVLLRLTKPGRAAALASGRPGLKAQLSGEGVKHRLVLLMKSK